MGLKSSVQTYYRLTKPGIVYGNALPTVAGFFLASQRHVHVGLLLGVLVGQSLVIACGCVLNNIIDRKIDAQMARTKKRALVAGDVSVRTAALYATILGVLGCLILGFYTNGLTLGIGLFGLFAYVLLYGIAKRRGTYGTVVGSISGALPPVAGYTAVTGHLDGAALLLFLILVCWQMPHFYAIAMYRLQDYRAASLPVLPVRRGLQRTKLSIVLWTAGFVVCTLLLSICGYTGWVYLVVAAVLGGSWLGMAVRGFKAADTVDTTTIADTKWARKMFFFSLLVLTAICAAIATSPWLP